MQTFETNPEYFEKKAEILKALSHPVRLCIVKSLLEVGESNVMNMQNCLKVPQSTISQYLAVLKSAGIIKGRREGSEVYYSVQNDYVKDIVKTLFTGE
ncbi:MAG: helix-turn-helix transcriptional regulator [Peptococcaceae bacterium]|nr:helix-turn-helix transcriptional regulator [Peptococcaceae bacterium]